MNNATQNNIGNNKISQRNGTRTKAKAIAPTVRRISGMDEAGKRHLRNPKRPTESSSDSSTSNDFLRNRFIPKLQESEITGMQGKRKSAKTVRDFYVSLSRLAEHYDIEPMSVKDYEYPYNIALSIWDIEKQLKNKCENWDNIRLIQDINKTYFVSEERCDTGTSLFYIPVIPLYTMLKDKTRKKSAHLLLSVCSYLYRIADVPYYRQESSYLHWNYEMLADWIEQDEEQEECKTYMAELQQAEIIGDIMEQKISHIQNISFFQQRLERFNSQNSFDKECYELAIKTFNLYQDYPDKNIFGNVYYNNVPKPENMDEDDYYEDETVLAIDKYISFFADGSGLIYQSLVDTVNNEFNEYGETQEPIVFKVFDGSEIAGNNLDFENRLFEVLRKLCGLLD